MSTGSRAAVTDTSDVRHGADRTLRVRRIWAAFALTHLWLIALNLFEPTSALSDVTGIYREWMQTGAAGGGWVGIDLPWVYPALAAVPMLISLVGGDAHFGLAWLVLVTLLDAAAFAVLLRRCRPRSLAPAWWWLLFLVALGPISLGRIDGVTVPLALAGLLLLSAHPALAGVLLTVGAWMKVWPAALLLAAWIALRGRVSATVAGAAALTTAVVVVVSVLLGSGWNVLGFIGQQAGRGLQVESTAALYHLWSIVAGDDRFRVYVDRRLITFEVSGPGTQGIADALTPIMVVIVLGVTALGIRAARRGVPADALLGPLSLALVTALIVTNKVGSPQYVTWLAVPIVAILVADRRSPRSTVVIARLGLVVAALTQLVYPVNYTLLVQAVPVMVAVVTLRDLGEIALLLMTVAHLWVLPRIREELPDADRGGRSVRARSLRARQPRRAA